MKKLLLAVLPVALSVTMFEAQAGYIPYVPKTDDKAPSTPSLKEYDQNGDFYITADEVEVELREDAVEKAVQMYKEGASQGEIDELIMDMEDSVETDAEAIIDKLDSDNDELVEPQESNL